MLCCCVGFFFFKQKTAYEMRISDWSSDVCSSDLAVITLAFADGVDPLAARQGIAERLTTVSSVLPAGVAAPQMSPLTSSTMDLLKFGLVSDRLDDFAMRDLADFSLRSRLLAVPGVARVTVFGGAVRLLQVQIDPQRLPAIGRAYV